MGDMMDMIEAYEMAVPVAVERRIQEEADLAVPHIREDMPLYGQEGRAAAETAQRDVEAQGDKQMCQGVREEGFQMWVEDVILVDSSEADK